MCASAEWIPVMPECQAEHNCEHLSPARRSRVPLQLSENLSRTLDTQRSLCFQPADDSGDISVFLRLLGGR